MSLVKILKDMKFRLALRALCKLAKVSGWTFERFVELAQEEWEKV